MKSIKYLVAAAMAMMAIGCAKEQVSSEIPDGQEINVTFNASLPEGIKTRALGDGTKANQLVVAVYDNTTGNELTSLRQTKGINISTTVEFNLVKGKTYSFVFWAHAEGNTYYKIDDLRNIIIDYNGKDANDETRDAFYATRMDMKVVGAMNETVTLHRPFSQVNFGTSDFDDAEKAGFVPVKSAFTATAAATVFDPINGEGKNGIDITLSAKELPAEDLKVKIAGVENTYKWITMNYFIPVGKLDEKHMSDVTATFTTADNQTVTISAPNAPVRSNYRTNILGSLLTDQTIFNVVIDPVFNEVEDTDPDYSNSPDYIYNQLSLALANGGEVTLTKDVVLNKKALVVPAGKNVVLNLNGKTITYEGDNVSPATALYVHGNLTINGDGSVYGGTGGDNIAVWAESGSKIIINNGKFDVGPDANGNGNACIYTTGGEIIINGGYFRSEASYNSKYYVLNKQNSSAGKIIVYGGQFENYNPQDGDDAGNPNSFVAAGYKCKKISDSPDVWGVFEPAAIFTKEEFVAAATANVENIVIKLQNDIEFGDGARTNFWEIGGSDTKTVTIEGTGNELLTYANDYRSQIKTVNPDAKLILKNFKMTSTNAPSPWDVYDILFCTPVEIENVTFNKAIGFIGASAYLKNVIIDESSNTKTCTYAMWVSPDKDMTITMDNCEIKNSAYSDGRAIKICDQYLTNPGKVTLTVNGGKFSASSTSKPFIYVGNKGGNTITTTGDIDITGIASGKMFAVESTYEGTATYNGTQF